MAVVKAKFGNIDFNQVEGFRISVCFTPTIGFDGSFFVYLWDWIDAERPFDDALSVGEEAKQDELTISDDDAITYRFPDISLTYAEMGATRSIRYRLVEFQYLQQVTDRPGSVDMSLENSLKRKLTKGALKSDYDFKLDDSAESPLGFRTRVAPHEAALVRFSSLRNNSNSFLEKIVEVNKTQASGRMPPFTIRFDQQDFEVNRDNLEYFFVDESYGSFTDMRLPSLDAIREAGADRSVQAMARLSPEDFSPRQLLDHDMRKLQQRFAGGDIVETATAIFKAGHYREMELK